MSNLDWKAKIALAVYFGIMAYNLFFGSKSLEGERCGPHHHYVYVTVDIYGSDLSCEDDRR